MQDVLENLGKVTGVAGVALGVALLVFREVLKKRIFPQLTRAQAARLLTLIVVLTWSIALAGLTAWFLAQASVAEVAKRTYRETEPPTFGLHPETDSTVEPEVVPLELTVDQAAVGNPDGGTWSRDPLDGHKAMNDRPSGVVVVHHRVIPNPVGGLTLPVLTATFKNKSGSLRILSGLRLSVLEKRIARNEPSSGVIQPSAMWLLELPRECAGQFTVPILASYSPDRAVRVASDDALSIELIVTPSVVQEGGAWKTEELDAGYTIRFEFLFDDGSVEFIDDV